VGAVTGRPRSHRARTERGQQVATDPPGQMTEPPPIDARQAAVVQMGDSDRGRLVLVRVGAVIEVRLPARATEPESSNPDVVDSLQLTEDDENREERRARFRARASGEATLSSTTHTGSRTGVVRRWSVRLKVEDNSAGASQVSPLTERATD
jgi:hypothetical protein